MFGYKTGKNGKNGKWQLHGLTEHDELTTEFEESGDMWGFEEVAVVCLDDHAVKVEESGDVRGFEEVAVVCLDDHAVKAEE